MKVWLWQLIHNYGHTELSQYEERICTRPQQAVAPMMIDGLSERAFCCACAVASTMISWFSLPLSSSFLNSPAKPMIEKLLSSQLVDQYMCQIIVGSPFVGLAWMEDRANHILSRKASERIVTKTLDSASGLPGDALGFCVYLLSHCH